MFKDDNDYNTQLNKNQTNRGRAWRRSQEKRIEKKAFKKFKISDTYYWDANNAAEKNALLLQRAKVEKDTMARCSCYMCGNARKWWKEETLQEKIFKDIEGSQD